MKKFFLILFGSTTFLAGGYIGACFYDDNKYKNDFKERIENSNSCNTDSDCTIIYGRGFQCGVGINKEKRSSFKNDSVRQIFLFLNIVYRHKMKNIGLCDTGEQVCKENKCAWDREPFPINPAKNQKNTFAKREYKSNSDLSLQAQSEKSLISSNPIEYDGYKAGISLSEYKEILISKGFKLDKSTRFSKSKSCNYNPKAGFSCFLPQGPIKRISILGSEEHVRLVMFNFNEPEANLPLVNILDSFNQGAKKDFLKKFTRNKMTEMQQKVYTMSYKKDCSYYSCETLKWDYVGGHIEAYVGFDESKGENQGTIFGLKLHKKNEQ